MSKMVRKRIVIIGWFSNLNAGDDRIGEVLVRFFYPHKVVLLDQILAKPYIINNFDLCVFTAGIWHPRFYIANSFSMWIRQITIPIIGIGLGVEKTDNPKIIREYENFVKECKFLYVRDNASKEALGNSDSIIVGPDCTWFYPFSPSHNKGSEKVYVNLRPNKKFSFQDLEVIVTLIRDRFKEEVLFYSNAPEDTELAAALGFRNDHIVFYHDDHFSISDAKLIIGMRFHSLVFAQQKCIPSLHIAYHEKVSNLFTNKLSYLNDILVDSIPKFQTKLESINQPLLTQERTLLLRQRAENIVHMEKIMVLTKEACEDIAPRSGKKYAKINKVRSLLLNLIGRY